VITPTLGLVPSDLPVTLPVMRRFGTVDIDQDDPRYRGPLERTVRELQRALPASCEVVLLGSIATGKYVDGLLGAFGGRLLFPKDFVGRGDMSRGGLMLRSARAGRELDCIPVAGAVLRGKRPPKLPRGGGLCI
jgi:hypothetical protein